MSGVRYPGLPGDPGHEVARRQMQRLSARSSPSTWARASAPSASSRACELVTEASSFGGVLTTAERRERWGGDDVTEGFIRLSAGCEDTADLVADVERALAAA